MSARERLLYGLACLLLAQGAVLLFGGPVWAGTGFGYIAFLIGIKR